MVTVSAFTTSKYPRQAVVVYLFLKSVNLLFMLKFKSDVIKDASSANMSHSLAVVKVLMKHIFFAFIPFIYSEDRISTILKNKKSLENII